MNLQRGSVGVIIVVSLLIVGIITGIILVSQRTNFLPKASSGEVETSLNITPANSSDDFIQVLPDNKFSLNLTLRSNSEPIKQINIKLRYPTKLIKIDAIDASSFGALPVEWQVREYDNEQGTATLIANIPGEGFKNNNSQPSLLARLDFSALPLTAGQIGQIEFLEKGTSLLSADGQVLDNVIQRSVEIRIGLAAQ